MARSRLARILKIMNLYFFKFPNFFQARVQGSTGTSIFAGSLFLSWPIQRQQFVGESEGALSGSVGINIMFKNRGGGRNHNDILFKFSCLGIQCFGKSKSI